MKQASNENVFMRRISPNFSEDGNSESAMTTLPMTEKRIQNHSSDNKGAAYQMMINDAIANTHLTGRNTFAFWTIVSIIFILTVGNLILTITIIGVLRLGKGMEYLELVPEADSVKFYGETDLDRIYKKDGIIEGFADMPVTVTVENSYAQISLMKPNGHIHTKMLMTKNGTSFHGVNQFDLKDGTTGDTIFTTHKPHYTLQSGMENLNAKSISSSRITSPIDIPLSVNNTRGKILFRGTEGVTLTGKEIFWSADQNIYLKAHNGSIIINGHDGVFLDIKNIPIVGEYGIKLENKQYKICVCMPQGKLFRIPVAPSSHAVKGVCSHFNVKYDPCM